MCSHHMHMHMYMYVGLKKVHVYVYISMHTIHFLNILIRDACMYMYVHVYFVQLVRTVYTCT